MNKISLHIHVGETVASKVQDEPINSLGLQELAVVKAIEANDTVALDWEGARKTGRWVLKMGE